jgi:hypothetical protein
LAPIRMMRAAVACCSSPDMTVPPRRRSRELFEAAGFFPIDLGDLATGGRLQQATGGPLAGLNLVQLP